MFSARGVRFVLHNHSSDAALLKKIPVFGSLVVRTLVRSANTIFCVNTKLTNQLISFFQSDTAHKNNIHTLPMGVSLNTVKQSISVQYDFAFIGRFVHKKGLDYFLDALIELHKQGIFPRVAVAGGPKNQHYANRIATMHNVEYRGFIQAEEKTTLLLSTRYIVLPSVEAHGDYEGMPVVLLEALGTGAGVIASQATNVTALPEWNSIKKHVYLLKNPANIDEFATILRSCLKAPAFQRKQLTRYMWSNLIEEYVSIIKK